MCQWTFSGNPGHVWHGFTPVHPFKLRPACTKCDLHSKLTYWMQKSGCGLFAVQSALTSVPMKRAFHTNMHTSCVASQLKWRVAVQLRDNISGKLVAYIGSWHLVRLVLCCPKCLLLPLPILITPIVAEFWACSKFVPKETIEYPTLTLSAMFTHFYMFCKQLSMWEYPR